MRLNCKYHFEGPITEYGKEGSMYPDDTYLALRMIYQVIDEIHYQQIEGALAEIVNLAQSLPDAVEWEAADQMFLHCFRRGIPSSSALHSMLKFVDNLNVFRGARVDHWIIGIRISYRRPAHCPHFRIG